MLICSNSNLPENLETLYVYPNTLSGDETKSAGINSDHSVGVIYQ